MIVPLSFLVAGMVGLILHESGHALAAWALGYKIVEIRIGDGKPMLRREIGPASVVIGRALRRGWVRAIPPVSDSAVAALLFIAAGPLVDIAVLLVYIRISSTFGSTLHVDTVMFGAIFCQAMKLASNLWPRTGTVGGHRQPNDGLALWYILSGKAKRQERATHAQLLAAYPVSGAVAASAPYMSQNALYLLAKLEIVGDTEHARIHSELAHEVDHVQRGPGKLHLLDRLVTFYLGQEPSALLENLDRWSQAALDLNPDLATLRGSRGAVLVELGRYQEGLDMLAHAEHGDAFNRSINEAFRALAFCRQGDLPAAKAMFETAQNTSRTLDHPNSFVSNILDRIGPEVLNGKNRNPAAEEGLPTISDRPPPEDGGLEALTRSQHDA